ncbi:uncharacterized protein MYCGRDRAFT_87541 [Zymoseptoria tritici IPO323]|uniref:Uncharacterized protein n=1 Tax=Zymoseptoria tritici (strain CBS 115943 / IPO323) TaxID=336722 RepID=F9XJA1_ZYMTI|nr:uncharacterized protein MYCGRDRAFT_87541 [Zymoseptoria tritici IPO323]EGP84416.1 hypothetical protein MYCGRDRAFT_87541 [Zymoseptoria tritici IPO323]
MIPSLQPSRPKVPAQSQHVQQQTRTFHTHATAPRNQIEAMPPFTTPETAKAQLVSPVSTYNPATTHPVFFMNNFRKPPFPLPMNTGFSPAATGYVFGRTRTDSNTKL